MLLLWNCMLGSVANSVLSNPVVISLPLCRGASAQHLVKLTFLPFETLSILELSGPTSPQPVNVRAPLLCSCYLGGLLYCPYFIVSVLMAFRCIYPAQTSLLTSTPIYTFGYGISPLEFLRSMSDLWRQKWNSWFSSPAHLSGLSRYSVRGTTVYTVY